MIKTKDYYVNNLKVLYEDNHVLVISKPEDVLSQKDITNDFDINEIVKEYLKKKYNKLGNVYLGLIHRLDRRVGGVMVLAKTSKAASRMSVSIMNHEFKKYYVSYVNGLINTDGEVNINIKKVNNMATIASDGKEAKLTYKVINQYNNNTFLSINLISGRYNQIRLSFASINHPLIGDYKYGGSNDVKRIGLWCYKIVFIHPVSKEEIEVVDYPSNDFWDYLDIDKIK